MPCHASSDGRVNATIWHFQLCVRLEITETMLSCPLSAGEPNTPVLMPDNMKVERNTFYIPIRQADQGASPLQHFNLRYRKVKAASFAWIIALYLQPSSCLIHALRIKTMPSGKKYSCRPVPNPYPSKTCPLGRAMKWRSQRSTSTAPPFLPHSTLPLESSPVCTHIFLIAIKFMAPCSVDVHFSPCYISNQSEPHDQRKRGWNRHCYFPSGIPDCGCHLLLQEPLRPAHVHRC